MSAENLPPLTEAHYRAVIEHLGEGMIVAQDERVVFANPRAAELAGLPMSDLLNSGLMARIHPEDQAMVMDRFRRRIAGEQVESRYEVRLLLPDGLVRWLAISVSVVPWNGRPAAMTFFSDVSEKKVLEAQLRETLEQRETILENALVGIAFLSHTNEFLWANKAMARMFGMTRGMARPKTWAELFENGQVQHDVMQGVIASLGSGHSFVDELHLRKMDGTLFWASVSGKQVSRTDPTQGTVWAVMDTTERKCLDAALKQSMSERDAVLNSAQVGICLNVGRHLQWANDKFEQITGYTRAQCVGQSVRMFFPDDDTFSADGAATVAALETNGTYTTEYELVRPDGTRYWAHLAGRRLSQADPKAGDIWTLTDVTQRRQLEEETRAALRGQVELNALRSRFLAMTSHEFRTPLAVILSSAELIKLYSDRMSRTERDEVIERIETGVQRMIGMLDRVQLIGKTDAQLLSFAPKPTQLAPLCRSIVAEARALCGTAPVVVALELSPDCIDGLFDDNLLRHMVGNLLANAIKYSPNGGSVVLRVFAQDGKTGFEVSDHGIGIPEGEIAHLFESFHRASNVGAIAGTGLGLAIVKKAVELHGGRVEVVSTLGQGSRFTLLL